MSLRALMSIGVCCAHCVALAPLQSSRDLVLRSKLVVDQLDSLSKEVANLKSRVDSGGFVAETALSRLIHLAAEPNAKAVLISKGILFSASTLLKRESTTPTVKRLAGSVVTLLTDEPVVSQVSDVQTGGDSSTFIVVPRPSRVYRPDQTVLDLSFGLQPSDSVVGDFWQRAEVDG